MKSKREREEACPVCTHFHDYEGGEACGICGHQLVAMATHGYSSSAFPSEIVGGWLYLGSHDIASRKELLKSMHVSHMLNAVETGPALFKSSFTYHQASTSPPDFDECCEFIEKARAAGKRLLVFCMSGQSKSPSVVIAYLMRQGVPLKEAYDLVKEKHPATDMKPADLVRLQEEEERLKRSGGQSAPCGISGPFGVTPQPNPVNGGCQFTSSAADWTKSAAAAAPCNFVFGAQHS